jgi:hypothetical protein
VREQGGRLAGDISTVALLLAIEPMY